MSNQNESASNVETGRDPHIATATTAQFRAIHSHSVRRRYNRLLTRQCLRQLRPDGAHEIRPIMVHEHAGGVPVAPHIRAYVDLDLTTGPETVILDLTFEDYRALLADNRKSIGCD